VTPLRYIALPDSQRVRRWLARWVPLRLRNSWWPGPRCLRCGDSYAWKRAAPIVLATPVSEHCAVTPLCVECGEGLAWEERRVWLEHDLIRLMEAKQTPWLLSLYDLDVAMRLADIYYGPQGGAVTTRRSRTDAGV